MKSSDIKVGKTYCNRGKGATRRIVLDIDVSCQPECWPEYWFGSKERPNEPGVLYKQHAPGGGYSDRLFLSSFASWAGKEVEP